MRNLTIAALAVSVCGAAASADVLRSFDLFDHPGGAIDPQAYGLRFDRFPDGQGENPATLSFEDQTTGASTVCLEVIDNNGQIDIRIFGKVWGNSATGGTDYGVWDLDVTYSDVDSFTMDGWYTDQTSTIGSLTPDDATAQAAAGGDYIRLKGNRSGSRSFIFNDDGHRLSGDSTSWVGRGWLKAYNIDGDQKERWMSDTRDFLFTAVERTFIPLPTGAAMAGIGLAGLGLRRRR